jgi:hypothetical protein
MPHGLDAFDAADRLERRLEFVLKDFAAERDVPAVGPDLHGLGV